MDTSLLMDAFIGSLQTFVIVIKAIVQHILRIPYKKLSGKRVLVTGAGRGLGREFALQLAKEGCKLVVLDIDEKTVKETADMINSGNPGTAVHFVTNVSNVDDIKKLHKKIKTDVGPIDILLNNAGIVASNSVLNSTDEEITRIIQVNLMSNFWMTRAFLPDMLERNDGHIVAVSSAAAFTAASNIAPYTASKYGVSGFMACVREELRKKKGCKVKTTTIHPFFLNSAPINVKHWEVNSRIGELSIPDVAAAGIDGIKREKAIVTIPSYLYPMMHFLLLLPQQAADLWRDMFYARIDKA